MLLIKQASLCVGMRFHAILLQTMLNGKNYIVDYTDAQNGKIKGLINLLGLTDQLDGRYISLEDKTSEKFEISKNTERFCINGNLINDLRSVYCNAIKEHQK